MRNAQTKINKETYKKYKEYCKTKDCSVHADLKNYIQSVIEAKREMGESKSEQRGSFKGDKPVNGPEIKADTGKTESTTTKTEEFRLWT